MPAVWVKPKGEPSLLRYHPWIYSGAIAEVEGALEPGDTVEVRARDHLLGRGAFSPFSQIRVRVWSFDPEEAIDRDFFRRRLARAIEARTSLQGHLDANAYRLVHAESDGIPGLIVDRYDQFLVCQFLTVGAELWRDTITALLAELTGARGIFERSDTPAREKEGLQPRTGVLLGDEPPALLEIREGAMKFAVNLHTGQKTGFYLDQRENRRLVGDFARNTATLNCFSYTGAFSIAALAGGATHVTNIEASADALRMGRENARLNAIDDSRMTDVEGDVFHVLRQFRDARRQFDLIVLDPPKFAESIRQVESASRGYKDINLLAMKLLKPGGLLCTFSCSGQIHEEQFQWILGEAARDAARPVQILRKLGHPLDHPVALHFPEGSYLKGYLLRVS